MASSPTADHHRQFTTTETISPPPPPPTPSNQTLSDPSSGTLSHFLLHNLTTPTLTLKTLNPPSTCLRRQPPSLPPQPPPVISLLDPQPSLLLTAATDHGFFHLSDHGIDLTTQHLDSLSTLQTSHAPNHSPLGLDLEDEDEDDEDDRHRLLVFDEKSCALPAGLLALACDMRRIGVEVVEMLLLAAGLRSPFKDGMNRARWLMWVVSSSPVKGDWLGGGWWMYPFVVCLQYEIRNWRKIDILLGDDHDDLRVVEVLPKPESILVTIGDIAQVWSNGSFKKVRGRASPTFSDNEGTDHVTMSLMVTLPIEDAIFPLPRIGHRCRNDTEGRGDAKEEEDEHRFCSFPLEQYAWRIYHEKLNFKDPLLRYRL